MARRVEADTIGMIPALHCASLHEANHGEVVGTTPFHEGLPHALAIFGSPVLAQLELALEPVHGNGEADDRFAEFVHEGRIESRQTPRFGRWPCPAQ